MNDVETLEYLREQLVTKAAAAEVEWGTRMTIYNRIQIIVERLIQLERQ